MEGKQGFSSQVTGSPSSSSTTRLSLEQSNSSSKLCENNEEQQAQQSDAALLSFWTSGDGSTNLEPYPLNLKPSAADQKRRFAALEAFLDLAIPVAKRQKLPGEEEDEDEDEQDNMQTNESSQERRRIRIEEILGADYASLPRIRDYQEQQWEKHYMDLVAYHQRHGHCCVPHAFKENPGLARWVKRQRYQYKLRQQGVAKSTMVPHRMKALEKLGFVWDSHSALWEEQLADLKVFRMVYSHCDVPSVFPANPQLSTWVKRQRRQYRENSMCQSRQDRLNEIGFDWKTR